MGGSVAVVLARELQDAQPQRIEKLLLLAPAGLTGKPMPLPPLLDRLGASFLGLPAVRRGLCRQAFADPNASVGPAEEEIASLHLSTPGWAAALACFARSGGFAGVGAPLPTAPIQVLWGAQDRILRAPQKRAAEALLGERLHTGGRLRPSAPSRSTRAGGQHLDGPMSGPALGVISQAIKLWLKRVCSQLEHLDLKLQGSLWRLLQGHLAGATVCAQGVVFQDLAIEQVELSSEPIDLDVGALLKGQPLQLRQSFAVKGWVQFSESGLTRCLQSPALADFSAELSSVLLGGQPLQRFEIQAEGSLHSAATDPARRRGLPVRFGSRRAEPAQSTEHLGGADGSRHHPGAAGAAIRSADAAGPFAGEPRSGWLTHQRQHQGDGVKHHRRGEQIAIHPIKNAAMAGDQRA